MSNDLVTHLRLLAPAFLETPAAADEALAPTPDPIAVDPVDDDYRSHERGPDEPEPAGKSFADLLVQGLLARGWEVEHRWITYTSHAFEARRAPSRYDVELELLAEPIGAASPRGLWRLVAKPRTKFFQRLFSTAIDLNEHALLRLHLEETLAHDPRTALGATPTQGHWRTERDDLALGPDALGA